MTQIEALARIRIILNETATGFYTDTQLYEFLDSGQNDVIQFALAKETMLRDIAYQSPLLMPLITLDTSNTTTVGATYQEYTLPTDFLGINAAQYSSTNAGAQKPCVIVDFNTAMKRGANAYKVSPNSPLVYTRAEKLGFFPQPTGGGANNYAHYYYKQPTPVASGQDFTLRENAQECCIEFAVSYAYFKDSNVSAGQLHRENAVQLLINLA